MSIPKIIHCLWLDFRTLSDGLMNDELNFFIGRIRELHPEPWRINFISNWRECLDGIDEEYEWIRGVINNPYINAANKSDLLRYYYLYKEGGIWVDLSTYIVTSFDEYIEKDNGFSCVYAPDKLVQSWMIKPLSTLYDMIPISNYLDILQNTTSNLNDMYSPYPFIPETYFCISKIKHPVSYYILVMLKEHYTTKDMSTDVNITNSNNEFMLSLFNDIFDINTGLLPPINRQLRMVHRDPENPENFEKRNQFLNSIFSGAYLFIYLVLYKAIIKVLQSDQYTKYMIPSEERHSVLDEYPYLENAICKNNSCSDLLYSSKMDSIFLISASYNRLSKWSDNLDQRLRWENTIAGDLILDSTSIEEMNQKLLEKDITQLKFGSWTRGSPIIKQIMRLTSQHRGGRKNIRSSYLNKTKKKRFKDKIKSKKMTLRKF